MMAYLTRRLLYSVPVVIGVVFLTFVLFFYVNTPEQMARRSLGMKANEEKVARWVRARGYDVPLFWNGAHGGARRVTETLLYRKCVRVLAFDLGRSDETHSDIAGEIRRRMGPSLAFAVPTFLVGLCVNITLSLIIAVCRGTYLDRAATVTCVLMMSVSVLFYIILGQFIFAKWLRLVPISGFGWEGNTAKFVLLPVLIGVIGGIGGGVRFYRTVMLEETGRDYVRTARAKGLGEGVVLFRHVLKNAMVPILTNAAMAIPFLFLGSLVMESFFSIPGLGSMTITAIHAKDYAVIRSMTFVGSLLYVTGLLLVDVSYTLVDPRITLGAGGGRSLYGRMGWRDGVVALLAVAVLGLLAAAGGWALSRLGRLDWRVPPAGNLGAVLVLGGLAGFLWHARRTDLWRRAWRQVRGNRLAMVSLIVLALYFGVGMLDSISWRDVEPSPPAAVRDGPVPVVFGEPRTILDRLCGPIADDQEKTYSAPLAERQLTSETLTENVDGKIVKRRVHPRLRRPGSHLLGTDKTGRDVLYLTLKSIRTGLVIGGLTTLIAVPFAICLGVIAGFFGGWIDDVIQYVYSTLASIPWVLLVTCFMMVYGQGIVQLCIVMGITGWVGLCRLLRGETLKLREREYVQAALALGVSKFRVLRRHVVPNLMHLVLISVVLRFSGLVLAEAVLSYIGVGVGPETASWGTMINHARSEFGREPMVWWTLAAAFTAMVGLVLPANLFGDALRDALDPTLRVRGAGE